MALLSFRAALSYQLKNGVHAIHIHIHKFHKNQQKPSVLGMV